MFLGVSGERYTGSVAISGSIPLCFTKKKTVCGLSFLSNLQDWLQIFEAESNLPDFNEFIRIGGMNEQNLRKALGGSAIVNLKKTWGKGSTNYKDLKEYLDDERIINILKEEINIINPKLILCGGAEVYYFAKKIFNPDSEKAIEILSKNINYFKHENMLFVEFYHPSCRKSREYLYDFAKMLASKL